MSFDLRRAPLPADPVRTYYAFMAAMSFFTAVAFTLSPVYAVRTVHLDPLQLVLVGTAMEASCFLFEIPTGVLADLVSRRVSVLVGTLLMGAAFALLGAVPTFSAVIAAQVVWALGYTCISGAADALLADEIGADRVGPVLQREQQLHLGATIAGIVAAGVLGLGSLRAPFLVAAVGFGCLTVVLGLVLRETAFAPAPRGDRSPVAHLLATTSAGLRLARRDRVVGAILVAGLLTGVASEAFDRLWTLHVLRTQTLPPLLGTRDPALWFAAIALGGTVVALLVSLVVNRVAESRLQAAHPNRLLALLALVRAASVVLFALAAPLWLALAGLWGRTAVTALVEPVEAAWLNRRIDGPSRATVLSTHSQVDAIGQVIGGPPLGALARSSGAVPALLTTAAVLVPVALLWLGVRDRRGSDGPAVAPAAVATGLPPGSEHRSGDHLPEA